MKSQLKTPVVL